MCGIAGAFAYRQPAAPVDEAEVVRMRDAMSRRGPDGAGLWASGDGSVAFGHRRLSIIDLSPSGSQPMVSADGRFTIVFNGEIYNYRALRERLVREGAALRSTSDTEVVVELYARRGAAILRELRGMYAFAIWDDCERRLFLARDAFGIKPLYYADDGRTLRFASQVRALLQATVDRAPDVAGHAGFWTWGFVPEPFTLYRSIQCLPAGSSMTVDARGPAPASAFFDVASIYREAEQSCARIDPSSAWERLGATLDDSVAHHLVADVPVGVFLSAGIDSTAIATFAARRAKDGLRTITLAAETHRGGALDESAIAAATARRLNLAHAVEPLARADFEESLPDVMASMDQPSTDGINTYFVARAAARHGLKVALSGLGGDEMFMGYPSFRDVPRIVRRFAWSRRVPWLGRAMRAASSPLVGWAASPKYAGLAEYGTDFAGAYLLRRGLFMPWELEEVMGRQAARDGWERLSTLPALAALHHGVHGERCIVSVLEAAWYMRGQLLRDADWAGMAHSLEIRVPFADVEVLRAVAPLAAHGLLRSKHDVARLHALGLPSEIVERPKTGFLVPVREWTLGSGRRFCDRGLRGWARKVSAYFRGRSVLALVTDAYGASGGIAQCMRDFLRAACEDTRTRRVVAFPRHAPDASAAMPEGLLFERSAAGGKLRYAAAVARKLLGDRDFDVVVCGHVNLLPVAYVAARCARAPLIVVVHGIDAWRPTRGAVANWAARRVDAVAAVSGVTRERFSVWSGAPRYRCAVLPNAFDPAAFAPGPRPPALVRRYGIDPGARVIMTLGRLSGDERYKGVDEVLEAMPRLLPAVPQLFYLVAGDGSDRARLEEKARALGVAGHVVFAGFVPEAEKADHYRLADVFVMPSSGEGFGIVFLEAMACGLPTIASRTDGGREALRDGELGRLVEPGDAAALDRAILEALHDAKSVPAGLAYFKFDRFAARWRALLERTCLLH